MNTFDVILLVVACGLIVLGMVKGLVRILIGLAALVAAFAVAARFHQPLSREIGFIDIGDEQKAKRIISLMEAFDDHDDVQNVYANFDISPEIMDRLA